MSKSKAPVVTGIKPKEAVPGTEITIRHSVYIRIVRPYKSETSKKQNTKPQIHQFKVLQKRPESLSKHLLTVCYYLFITLTNILSLAFSFKKALKDIMQHFKFKNW